MREVNLTVEVHCNKPIWATLGSFYKKFSNSRYRIYINNDLITERSWIWNNSVVLLENIWFYGNAGENYNLDIKPVVYVPEQVIFKLDNFSIVNTDSNINKIDDLQVNFTLR